MQTPRTATILFFITARVAQPKHRRFLPASCRTSVYEQEKWFRHCLLLAFNSYKKNVKNNQPLCRLWSIFWSNRSRLSLFQSLYTYLFEHNKVVKSRSDLSYHRNKKQMWSYLDGFGKLWAFSIPPNFRKSGNSGKWYTKTSRKNFQKCWKTVEFPEGEPFNRKF